MVIVMPLGDHIPLFVLSSCTFEDFKSYRKASLPLRPLTLLVGANASGKSNLIEGIRFLTLLAQGRRIDEVWRATHDSDIAIRGAQPLALFRPGCEKLTLGCRVERAVGGGGALFLETQIQRSKDSRLHIFSEKLSEGEDWLYAKSTTQFSGPGVTVRYNNFSRGGKKPMLTLADDQALFVQLQSEQSFGAHHGVSRARIPKATKRIRSALSNVHFLDPVPSAMRGGSFPADDRLREDGRNVSAVLYNLCQDASQREKALEFIRSLPEQDIRSIDFVKGARGDVVIALSESFGKEQRSYDATLLSDGTLRALAMIAALLSVPRGTLLVIEELDNGIHPSRAKRLMAGVERIARERSLRVLITTHNPALVDALPLGAVPDIVLCYRDPDEGYSRLSRLDELPDYAAMIGHHSVGQLMTEGLLERATRTVSVSPDAQRTRATTFLQQFLQSSTEGQGKPGGEDVSSDPDEDIDP